MNWITEDLLHAVAKASPNDCITETRMAEITGQTANQIEKAALKLRKYGLMEKTDRGCHKLTEAGRAAAAQGKKLRSGPTTWTGPKVHKGTLRQRAWTAMRISEKFSLPDLCTLVAEGGEKDLMSNLRKYVKALERGGYLVRLARRERGVALTSNGFVRWWLKPESVTGLQAPVWSERKNRIYDPNTEQFIELGEVCDVA